MLPRDTWGQSFASVQLDSIGKVLKDASLNYQFKETVLESLLGMVDDLIGIIEAGHQAREINALIDIKTAEKRLKFSDSKCKTILVGRSSEKFHHNKLYTDSWNVSYDIVQSCDKQICSKKCNELSDTFQGKI